MAVHNVFWTIWVIIKYRTQFVFAFMRYFHRGYSIEDARIFSDNDVLETMSADYKRLRQEIRELEEAIAKEKIQE